MSFRDPRPRRPASSAPQQCASAGRLLGVWAAGAWQRYSVIVGVYLIVSQPLSGWDGEGGRGAFTAGEEGPLQGIYVLLERWFYIGLQTYKYITSKAGDLVVRR